MSRQPQTFVAFSNPLSDFLERHKKEAIAEVESRSEEKLFSDSDSQFVSGVVQRYKVNPPEIDFDMNNARKTSKNEQGSAFIYHLSYSGDGDLLRYRPNTFGFNPPTLSVSDNEIAFEIEWYGRDATEIRNEAQGTINQIKTYTEPLLQDVQRFNDSLTNILYRSIDERKAKIIKRREILGQL